jgi:hypothetical protein
VARIHLILAGHLAMSPRGRREATVLRAAGHDVTLSGIWFDPHLAVIDRKLMRRESLRFSPALDLRPGMGRTRRFSAQLMGRCAREMFRLTGHFSPSLLGYGVAEQLSEARRMEADLTIVHSEAGLWIAQELLREGRRVGIDFEDWFSQDLPVSEHLTRPVDELARLEATILQRAVYRVASSCGMARALSEAYAVPLPAVVTNAGQDSAVSNISTLPRDPATPLRLHWFSQTIGPARGLELLTEALPLLRHPVQVTLRGACSPKNRAWLERIIPKASRSFVTIMPPVPPWRLAESVAAHEVGLALETSAIPNRELCISNKFFQYLAGGLAVITTPTQGQREAMAPCPDVGTLLEEASFPALAAAIDAYAAEPKRLENARRAARTAAAGCWNGNRERDVIMAEAALALGHESAKTSELVRFSSVARRSTATH